MRTERGISIFVCVVMITAFVVSLTGVSSLAAKPAPAETGSSAKPVAYETVTGTQGGGSRSVNKTKDVGPSDDTFICGDNVSAGPQGTAKNEYVGTELYSGTWENVRGLWKFDLASVIPSYVGIDNIVSAYFSAFTHYGAEHSDYSTNTELWVSCGGINNDSWSEATTVWGTAPSEATTHPPGVPALDTKRILGYGVGMDKRYSWNILSFVKDQWENDPDQVATMFLWSENEGGDSPPIPGRTDNYVCFTSKESPYWLTQQSYIEVTYQMEAYGVMVEISPNYAEAPLDGKLYYTVTVTNVGFNMDSYTLTNFDDLSWGLAIDNGTGGNSFLNVPSENSRRATLTVTVPSAALGDLDTITVTATGAATGVFDDDTCVGRAMDQLKPPTADALVRSDYPTTNYGSDQLAGTNTGVGTYLTNQLYAYLKFNLKSLPAGYSYDSAKLYLQCFDTFFSAGTPQWVDLEVCEVATDTWMENTITWSNKPAPGSVINTQRITLYDEKGWIIWDVKDYVDEQIADNENYITFCVRGVASTLASHSASFRSKEFGDSKYWPCLDFGEGVQLTIEPGTRDVLGGSDPHFTVTIKNTGGSSDNYNLGVVEVPVWGAQLDNNRVENLAPGASVTRDLWVTTCPPPPGTDHITVTATSDSTLASDDDMCVVYLTDNALSPDDDAAVISGAPDNVTGYDTGYYVQSWPVGAFKNERTFIKYDLRGIPAENYVKSAKLYFWCYSAFRNDIDAQACAVGDSWAEETITWNNQPACGDVIGETTLWSWRPPEQYGVENTWVAWDVTSFIAGQRKYGDNIASFCIKAAVENTSGGYIFDSKEFYTENMRPYLYVELGPSQPDVSVSISPVHRVGDPAEEVTYEVKVMNTGNIVDNYTLATTGGTLDSSGPFANVNPGESRSTTLRVTLPGTEGAENTITVTATGTGVQDNENCTASVKRYKGWEVAGYAPRIDNYGVAVTGAGGYIYVANGDDLSVRANFMRYDPNTGEWDSLATPDGVLYPDNPSPFTNGACLAWDGGNYIYALCGASYTADRSSFVRYNISTGEWEKLTNTPGIQGAGDGLAVGSDGWVYALTGRTASLIPANSRGTVFAKYNPATGLWDNTLPEPWTYTDDGAALVTVGDNIYATQGENYETGPAVTSFRVYSSGSWIDKAAFPEGEDDGTSLAYEGSGDYIYALGGSYSYFEELGDNFYRYKISTNTWEELESIPSGVHDQNGQRLGVVGSDIYCWKGCDANPVLWVYAQHIQRGRIYIRGNENFTSANGVRSGSGTALDPFIIEGWDITYNESSDMLTYKGAIDVGETDNYLVIQNCRLTLGQWTGSYAIWPPYGVLLSDVQHATVRYMDIIDGRAGIMVRDSSAGVGVPYSAFNSIVNNRVDGGWYGIYHYADTATNGDTGSFILNNTIVNNMQTGLAAIGSKNLTVRNNRMENVGLGWTGRLTMGMGMVIGSTTDSLVENNTTIGYMGTYCGQRYGILLQNSLNLVIRYNEVINCRDPGIIASSYTSIPPGAPRCLNIRIYLNNFINTDIDPDYPWYCSNRPQGVDMTASNDNIRWDNGTRGNYWDNYDNVDANSDGIWDNPYTLNVNWGQPTKKDNKPLVNPYQYYL